VDAGTEQFDTVLTFVSSGSGKVQFDKIISPVSDAISAEVDTLQIRTNDASSTMSDLQRVLAAGALVAIALTAVLAASLAREISGSMNQFARIVRGIASGRYGERIGFTRKDEIGQAAEAFDLMAHHLNLSMTELNRSIDSARGEANRVSTILNNLAEGIVVFDSDGSIEEASSAVEAMFARSPAELNRSSISDFLWTDPALKTNVDILDILPARYEIAVHHDQFFSTRHCNDSFPLEIAISTLPQCYGQTFLAIIRDITERRVGEEQVARQLSLIERANTVSRASLEASSEAISLVTPAATILTINRAYSLMFGIALEDIVLMSTAELIEHFTSVLEDGELERILQTIAERPDEEVRMVVRQKFPAVRELQLFVSMVQTLKGDAIGRLYAFRDVTHEREIDRLKSEFVSMVSHELRTPLTSIKGYVDLLLDGDVGELERDQHEFLEIVANDADRLVSLINDLLDISIIEAGKVDLNRTSIDLYPIAMQLVNSFRLQLETKRQHLSVDVSDDLPRVFAGSDRLNQIMSNLISNASKYTPAGGTIFIPATSSPGMVSFSIRDTGIGLSSVELEQLFTRFYRARNRATQEVSGTGLGLSITRSLIELHGGSIAVASEVGSGSTFTVSLPQALDEECNPPVGHGNVRPNGKVLVVEDEIDIANLIRRYLVRAGYDVMIASTASEAFEKARSNDLDLIALDIILPDTDGYTLLEWLKADPSTQSIPVIVVSMMPDGEKSKRLGALDYLTKPVDEHTLVSHIDRLLNHRRQGAILVADDEDDVRRLIAIHFENAGYTVFQAADGLTALEVVKGGDVDAVLLDVRMPGMDGIAVLRSVRQQETIRHLPIIMMTASPGAMEDASSVATDLGVTDLLRKPLSVEELADTILRNL